MNLERQHLRLRRWIKELCWIKELGRIKQSGIWKPWLWLWLIFSTLYLAKVFYVPPAIRNIENEKGCEVMDEDSKVLDPNEKLLLSIHEQCETLQRVIGMNYGIPHKDMSSEDNIPMPYEGLTKEVLCLLSLLMVYTIKHYSPAYFYITKHYDPT